MSTAETLIEEMGRAIFDVAERERAAHLGTREKGWHECSEETRAAYRFQARAVLPIALEAAAKVVDDNQETFSSTADGDGRFLTRRSHGNRAGIAYAAGIRALSPAPQETPDVR